MLRLERRTSSRVTETPIHGTSRVGGETAGLAEAQSALKRRAAAASVAASLVLAVVKLAAGFASGSLALLSEGAHNALDIGASALTLFAVREADKPADVDHQFGHAKIEAVAALAQTGFLAALSIGVAVQAIERIRVGTVVVDVNAFAIGVVVFSIAVDLVRWRGLTHVARLTSSHALAADALHFSSDLVSSVLVLLGLAATWAGYPHADALAALGVAGFIAVAGYRLGRETIDALVDRAPEGLTEAMRALVVQTPRVARRWSGRRGIQGGACGADRPTMAAGGSHHHRQPDRARRRDDPRAGAAGRHAAAAAGASCHHPGHRRAQERLARSRGRRRDDLERRPFHRFRPRGGDRRRNRVEVETHIEPAESEACSEAADPDLTRRIEAQLAGAVGAQKRLRDIHDVRVRASPGGLFVLFHCRVDPATPVEAVHSAVDALERSVREAFPQVRRAVGHAEPSSGGAT